MEQPLQKNDPAHYHHRHSKDEVPHPVYTPSPLYRGIRGWITETAGLMLVANAIVAAGAKLFSKYKFKDVFAQGMQSGWNWSLAAMFGLVGGITAAAQADRVKQTILHREVLIHKNEALTTQLGETTQALNMATGNAPQQATQVPPHGHAEMLQPPASHAEKIESAKLAAAEAGPTIH